MVGTHVGDVSRGALATCFRRKRGKIVEEAEALQKVQKGEGWPGVNVYTYESSWRKIEPLTRGDPNNKGFFFLNAWTPLF